MSDVPFHLTVMGRRFYEATMPALVEAIERLNEHLARLSSLAAVSEPLTPPASPGCEVPPSSRR